MNETALKLDVTLDDICVWKEVIIDSMKGIGTSYNVDKLTKHQIYCYWCTGVNYGCRLYTIKD